MEFPPIPTSNIQHKKFHIRMGTFTLYLLCAQHTCTKSELQHPKKRKRKNRRGILPNASLQHVFSDVWEAWVKRPFPSLPYIIRFAHALDLGWVVSIGMPVLFPLPLFPMSSCLILANTPYPKHTTITTRPRSIRPMFTPILGGDVEKRGAFQMLALI